MLLGQQPRDTARAPAPDSVYTLAGLIVEATRPVAQMAGASAVELRLDSLGAVPSATLGEALRRMPLLRIRQNSRGEDQPSLRGANERQIAVLVDGIPLTLGWDNRTDLSLIPLTSARELIVVRGLSSVLAGPNVLGGVIMAGITGGPFPEQLTRPARMQVAVEHTGALSTASELGGLWRSGEHGLLVRAGAGSRDRPGLVRPGDLAQPSDDDWLLNTDLSQRNGFLAARYQQDGGRWVSLSSLAFTAEKGILPELHIREPRFWRIPSVWRSVTALATGTGWKPTPWGNGDLEAMIGIDVGHQRIDAYESSDFGRAIAAETDDSRVLTLRLLGEHSLGRGIARGSFTVADARHDHDEPDTRGIFQQRLWSVGAEVEQMLSRSRSTSGWLTDPVINAGLSVDGASTPRAGGRQRREPDAAWGARLAGSMALANGVARLHGGISRKVRFPALRELYSGALGRFEPNPNLGPEELSVAELGVTGSIDLVQAQLTLFQQRLEGAIVRASLPDGRFRRENRDQVRSTGLELMTSVPFGALTMGGDLTLQNVSVLDPTAPQGERRPEYQPEVSG
ncbi:MAG: TonB-dependent receptor, partial [Gemmatimonadetes bacterium]|nr:TonB-dependent receptor [Gemmatimonadota bacterium]